jgi:sterol desaturase/sphingolipid hydroxylase (fatty acid hydroxylase superfamily)
MTEGEFQLIKSVGFVVALLAAYGLQRLHPHGPPGQSWRVNGSLWALNVIVLGLLCAGCACTVSRWAAEAGFGLLNQAAAPIYASVVVSVISLDLISYVWHRANHRISFLWRFHQVHHSDPDYTVSTALRFHPGELTLALPVRLLAVAALGVPISGVIIFEVLFAFSNFFEHGNIDLSRKLESWLGRLIVTPALHRRHHSQRSALLNSNYGTIFSVWDRLFRSFAESRSNDAIHVGLPGLEGPAGLPQALMMPARGVFRGD